MEIFEQTGWNYGLNELERDYEVVANIVVKCYVVGERIKYFNDGSRSIKYEVVFLYRESMEAYQLFKINYPEYNLFTNECTNSVFVPTLFNTFSEAKAMANKANDEILDKKIMRIHFGKSLKDDIAKIEEEHNKTLTKYQIVEEDLEDKTKDVEITELKEIDNLSRDELIVKRILSK